MQEKGNKEIAEAWLTNCRSAIAYGSDSVQADGSFWAYEELDKLCSTDPGRAVEIVRLIAQQWPEDRVMFNLAAGPLEDLLVRHGPEVIDQIEKLANDFDYFLFLVSGVWVDRMSPDTQARVVRLIETVDARGLVPNPQRGTH